MRYNLTMTSVLTFIVIIIVAFIIRYSLLNPAGKIRIDTPRPIIANPQPTPLASEPMPFYPNNGKE